MPRPARCLSAFAALFLVLSPPLSADEAAATARPNPPKSPVAPAQEQVDFRLAPGLRIDMIASEPQIESPVHCAFDEYGKLWVVEMRDYPNGPSPGEAPGGRIKVLEDRDGDGRFETATLFAEELLFANSLLPWNGGVIVTAAPQILYLKDTDGDGRADVRDVLFEGFVAGNPQLRVSNPVLGPDGWVYVANGLRGGEIRAAGDPNAKAIPIGGKDFRFDPLTKKAEAVPGPGQFGNTIDSFGARFVCDNRNHLRHVVFPVDPGTRNPLLAAPSFLEDVAGPADGPLSSGTKVYPLTRNWTTSNLHAGRFTASCGVFADRGGLLPVPFSGGFFTCEPTGNLVHIESLTPAGATFHSQTWKEGIEFLASPDEWFRPVSLSQAPDGSLVLVDMYRAVIEHPEFMPPELKNRPDLLLGRERGRLWRIAPADSAPAKQAAPGKLDAPALVKQLENPNGWHRTVAQRQLMESWHNATGAAAKDQVVKTVGEFAQQTQSPEGLLHAAWLVNRLASDSPELRKPAELKAMQHPHARLRENAARMREDVLTHDPETLTQYALLAADADARVRFQAALSLGACDRDEIVPLLAKIASRDYADRWTRLAVESSAAGRTAQLVESLYAAGGDFTEGGPASLAFVQELCELAGSSKSPAEVKATLDVLAKLPASAARVGLLGLADGVARRGTSFQTFLKTVPGRPEATAALLADGVKPALDDAAPVVLRVAAIRLLGHMSWDDASPVLRQLLALDECPLDVTLRALRSLAAHPRPEVAELLLSRWAAYTPALRSEVLEHLLTRADWANILLGAVEAGRIKAGDIDPTRARRLISSPDAALAARAKTVLKDSLPADRTGVVERYRAALTLEADLERGREVFRKNCSACHSVAGVGGNVGPDISDTRTKTPEMLLTDILNPNAAIDGNYVSYNVTTRDGRVLTGIIASESAGGFVLKRDSNKQDTVIRADVEEVDSSGMSLMPEGLEKAMTPQDVADVIRFLKRWRFAEDAAPLGE